MGNTCLNISFRGTVDFQYKCHQLLLTLRFYRGDVVSPEGCISANKEMVLTLRKINIPTITHGYLTKNKIETHVLLQLAAGTF